MVDRLKFSVIIPTRERADTLFHCLRTVLNQNYDNLTVIVSDNYSQDNTKEVVESFSDSRIKYINTGKRVSMSHNWEFALSHVTDGWVTFLGDDDGMYPNALKRIEEVILETKARAVTSKWEFYFWPQSSEGAGELIVPLTSGFEVRNCKEWLKKLMRGQAGYQDLPYIYTGGFVDVSLLNEARNEKGSFFCSMTPDVYSAIALSSVMDSYVMLHEPVCVMGVSKHSNGQSSLGVGVSSKPSEKFFSEKNIPFHSLLGSEKVRSIHIIVYESYLQAVHLHKNFLNISMVEELGLALARCPSEHYAGLKIYCDGVANKNGIKVNEVDFFERKFKKSYLSERVESLCLPWHRLSVNATDYSVSNVYEAALLANTLYIYNSQNKYWRLYNFQQLLQKAFFKVWRMLT